MDTLIASLPRAREPRKPRLGAITMEVQRCPALLAAPELLVSVSAIRSWWQQQQQQQQAERRPPAPLMRPRIRLKNSIKEVRAC